MKNESATLSDHELLASLDSLAREERQVGAAIISHLAEVSRRRLHLDLGYSSLFTYCVERLGMSRDVALKRMQAARLARVLPSIPEDLETGALSLSTAAMLAPHVTCGPGWGQLDAAGLELVAEARNRSKREVERLIAEWRGAHAPGQVEEPRVTFRPVVGGGTEITVTVSAEVAQLIEDAVALDRHLDPTGNVANLLGRALERYVKARKKQRFAEGCAPRPGTRDDLETTTIPADVRRDVVARDEHQCAFVGTDGHRCTERAFLELDHVQARKLGGGHRTADDVQLLCRAHNQRRAELSYGATYVEEKRARPKSPVSKVELVAHGIEGGAVDARGRPPPL